MRANLRHKQAWLGDAGTIVAVSNYVAAALRARVPEIARTRMVAIPNGVDVKGVRDHTAAASRPVAERYALFVGKLAKNKGAHVLVDVMRRARLDIPLVVLGDGPERAAIERAAGGSIRVLGWRGRNEVFCWLRHAELLLFPSVWPEPLSRVLIEASALAVPIAAMNTGGTSDIVLDEETGLLSTTVEGLADDAARLASDSTLRSSLGERAAARAASLFDIPVVIDQMEALYRHAMA
jgi:glycosyltransferase involved in cell wall biosynthesis